MPRGKRNPDFNQIKYQHEYNKQNYDRIEVTVPKGRKQIIKDAAQAAGQSTNEFINQAINAHLGE